MSRMAGYNLVEDSSGKNKSGTKISKRGRKNLRSVLYQMALVMVATNDEMRQLYRYLKTRRKPPEEDAGTDCHQQEDTDADPYACQKERELRSGESLRACPQGAAESCRMRIE